MGGARPFLEGGHLFRLDLTGNRHKIGVDDPRLEDRVADNLNKWELTESESLLFGRNFGVVTDIQTGPNGNLYLVSLSNGVVYEIFRSGGLVIAPARLAGRAWLTAPSYDLSRGRRRGNASGRWSGSVSSAWGCRRPASA